MKQRRTEPGNEGIIGNVNAQVVAVGRGASATQTLGPTGAHTAEDAAGPYAAIRESIPQAELLRWTGGAKVATVAVVFTDIVDSTKLCNELSDAVWDGIRQRHFERALALIRERQGILIKNTGDGILALFHEATAALSFAIELHKDTGHAAVRVRVGAHIGQVSIDGGDAFGRHVNFTARVMSHATADGVTVSRRFKEDVSERGEAWTRNLGWTEFPNVSLKGFGRPETIWGVGR